MSITNSKDFINNVADERCNESEFIKIAIEFCDSLKVLGMTTLPFRSSSNLHFSKRSKKDQKKIIAYLDISLAIFNECILSGGTEAFDNRVLLWRLLKRIGGVPQDDLFDKIKDDDLIEVYFPDHTPLFRNFKFYREFSYTVDEALCQTWYQFCRRDLTVTLKTMKAALLFQRNSKQTTLWTIPRHYVDERGTAMELRASMLQKYISGVHHEGKLTAMICTSEVNIVGAKGKLFDEIG